MAWIRRVRTASGATAVQIAEYVQGRREIVAHVGSAHTDAELGLLMAQARGLLTDEGQDKLDLGVEATPVKTDLVARSVADNSLFTATTGTAGPAAQGRRVSAPQVVATSSRLLFDSIAGGVLLEDDAGQCGGGGLLVPQLGGLVVEVDLTLVVDPDLDLRESPVAAAQVLAAASATVPAGRIDLTANRVGNALGVGHTSYGCLPLLRSAGERTWPLRGVHLMLEVQDYEHALTGWLGDFADEVTDEQRANVIHVWKRVDDYYPPVLDEDGEVLDDHNDEQTLAGTGAAQIALGWSTLTEFGEARTKALLAAKQAMDTLTGAVLASLAAASQKRKSPVRQV